MKLLELEVRNVRGLPHLCLNPNGQNIVICGPNGSGKSSIVDAVDFLLTGNITRLTGAGTGSISLKKHGKHVDSSPKDAFVRARVRLPSGGEVEVKRSIAYPERVECDNAFRDELDRVLSLVALGQHMLTRRDILRYITAEPSKRAEQIQALLKLEEIESIRKTLVRVQNRLAKDFDEARSVRETAEGQINRIVGETSFSSQRVLETVNHHRVLLGAEPIDELRADHVKRNLSFRVSQSSGEILNPSIFGNDVSNLVKVTDGESHAKLAEFDRDLRADLATIRANPSLFHALRQRQLTELGLSLLDDSGKCPLCEAEWPQGQLQSKFVDQLSSAEEGAEYLARIGERSKSLSELISFAISSLRKVLAAARNVVGQDVTAPLEKWLDDLSYLKGTLVAPIETYPDSRFQENAVATLVAPTDLIQILDVITLAVANKYPECGPEQTAYDTLNGLELSLTTWEKVCSEYCSAQLMAERAEKLHATFLSARDNILGRLYKDIREKFETLYCQLHREDEPSFTAKLEPDGARLNLEVDFYGRGMHPPHALHSEGHQDSMGLCLFLALSERLTQGLVHLIILDDVIMSVDAGHRKELCRVLATSFKDHQILIATHDRTWYNQLKGEGVVARAGTVELYGWHITTGPTMCTEVDAWNRIYEDLEKNDVASASAKLRRWGEEFFREMSDNLAAPVPYRLDDQYSLGDFLPAAVGRWDKWLKLAKKSAQSWKNEVLQTELDELQRIKDEIYGRIQADQWTVNATVHFNPWENLSAPEFRLIVRAFEDLHALFVCETCFGAIHLDKRVSPESVRCNCGRFNWNLVERL